MRFNNHAVACALCMLGLCFLGCTLDQPRGSRQPAYTSGNALEQQPQQGEAATGLREHPRIGALAPQASVDGIVDAAQPAVDEQGQFLASGSVTLSAQGAQLASASGLNWVIYAASAASITPDRLRLEFSQRDGAIWCALPDYIKQRWEWTQLPEGMIIDLPVDEANALKDGVLYFTLAVHDGASATFSGGELYNAANGPSTGNGEPQDKLPQTVGVYLSLGYWDEAAVDATMAQLKELGVNLVIDYALIAPEDEYWSAAFEHYLAEAQANGIGVAFYLAPLLYGMTPDAPGAHEDAVLAQVEQLMDRDAITAWYVHDEILPDVENDWGSGRYAMSLQQMQHLYSRIHAADPGRPQLNVWCYLPSYDEFTNAYIQFASWGEQDWMHSAEAYEQAMQDMMQTTCDWVLADSYPVGAPWGAGDPATEVLALCQRAAELKGADQPLCFVFQAFSWAQYDPQGAAGAPFPSRDEMEAMLSAARTAGADGAVAYSWFDLTAPEQDAAGREAALATTQQVLTALAETGWPDVALPLTPAVQEFSGKAASSMSKLRHSPRLKSGTH